MPTRKKTDHVNEPINAKIKRLIIEKYGDMTKFSLENSLNYNAVSNVIYGRSSDIRVVAVFYEQFGIHPSDLLYPPMEYRKDATS